MGRKPSLISPISSSSSSSSFYLRGFCCFLPSTIAESRTCNTISTGFFFYTLVHKQQIPSFFLLRSNPLFLLSSRNRPLYTSSSPRDCPRDFTKVHFVTLLVSLSRFLLFGALEIKFDAVCPQCSSLSHTHTEIKIVEPLAQEWMS